MATHDSGGFIPYPTNRVAGTISDAAQASLAVEALVRAGFDRASIDVLHGEQDLHRLDPSGAEHGLFARLQRTLITGAVGSEFKHLNHHVDDVRAGRFVVMALAQDGHARDRAADILHAHGAEFVGFYGRWAYESLPAQPDATRVTGTTYDITTGGETIRVELTTDGTATIPSASQQATATRLSSDLWLISWRRNDTAFAHVIDVTTGVAYTSATVSTGAPTHAKGTVTLVE